MGMISAYEGTSPDTLSYPAGEVGRSAGRLADQVEVVLDGGVRRGSDVVEALALGARAVMTDRSYLRGLTANGQAGVENLLAVLHSGSDSALLARVTPPLRTSVPRTSSSHSASPVSSASWEPRSTSDETSSTWMRRTLRAGTFGPD